MIVIVPMAGRGSRFAKHGITTPKPLIEVANQPIVAWALKSIQGISYSKLIVVILEEHEVVYRVSSWLEKNFGAHVVQIPQVTEGQLCTVLAARNFIDTDEDILIISSDTYVVSQLGQHIDQRSKDCAGIISVANMPGDRWSFARVDEMGNVTQVAEKVRISDYASTGMYYFANGHQFVLLADAIIANCETTQGEYYIMPLYQKYIERGLKVQISQADAMWDLGTPSALDDFETYLIEHSLYVKR